MRRTALCLKASALFSIALAGCVERGDFGRVQPSVWNDLVGATGRVAARRRGEPVSAFPLTDAETELRGRAWRFLVPAHDGAWLDRILAELVATRILPADMVEPDRHAYHDALLAEGARSPASLYRRIADDASADAHLIAPLGGAAERVLGADRQRLLALAALASPSPAEVRNARARVAENRCLVAWLVSASAFRVESYAYALQHLVVEAPQADAVLAERAIRGLSAQRMRLEQLASRLSPP